nr:zinc ion binding protein [Tanacetum cinerariifolium]
MRALFNKVCIKDPTWKLFGFIVDDPLTDVLTIREVFQCSVLVCFWRVRHACLKNLMKRCLDMQTRANLSKALGQIVKDISKGCGTVEAFNSFMEIFVECKDFMDYFEAS